MFNWQFSVWTLTTGSFALIASVPEWIVLSRERPSENCEGAQNFPWLRIVYDPKLSTAPIAADQQACLANLVTIQVGEIGRDDQGRGGTVMI